MKKTVKILAIVIAVFFLLGALKNIIAKNMITGTLSAVSHVPVKADGVNLSFFAASIRVKGLKVYNPSGFPEKLMASIPEIFIDFEPNDLFKGRGHFKNVKLNLQELIVVRDKTGRLNVDAVKPTEQQKKDTKAKSKPPAGRQAPKLLIDRLTLSIGKVTYKDYSSGGEPSVQHFDINIENRVYEHIDNPTAVVSLLMFEALTRTTLSRLVNLDLDSFKEGGIQALSKGLGLVNEGSDAVQNTTKQILNIFSK